MLQSKKVIFEAFRMNISVQKSNKLGIFSKKPNILGFMWLERVEFVGLKIAFRSTQEVGSQVEGSINLDPPIMNDDAVVELSSQKLEEKRKGK